MTCFTVPNSCSNKLTYLRNIDSSNLQKRWRSFDCCNNSLVTDNTINYPFKTERFDKRSFNFHWSLLIVDFSSYIKFYHFIVTNSATYAYYCVCVKRIMLCHCLYSSSCCFSASAIWNIGVFGAKSYFTDHRRANAIHSFTDSFPAFKIYNCY